MHPLSPYLDLATGDRVPFPLMPFTLHFKLNRQLPKYCMPCSSFSSPNALGTVCDVVEDIHVGRSGA